MVLRLEVGATFYRYKLLSLLGEGGMARVYRVRHQQLGTEHALKVLVSASDDVRERLLHEGRVQASLKNPNIVNVTDVIDVEGLPGLIMELVEGPTLQELLTTKRLSVRQVDMLATGMLKGVAFAHRKRLIHRDLKPANILCLLGEGTVVPKVADFGLVKVVEGDGAGMHNTRSGMMMGTPHYMSPEQIRDSKRVDERADVWALGVILYRMATGVLPFGGESVFDVMTAASAGKYQPVLAVAPETPERMAKAIEAALTVDPEHRPANAAEMLELWSGPGRVVSDEWADELVSDYNVASEMPQHSEEVMSDATLSGLYQPDSQEKPAAMRKDDTLSPVTVAPEDLISVHESVAANMEEPAVPVRRRRTGLLGVVLLAFAGVMATVLWFGFAGNEDPMDREPAVVAPKVQKSAPLAAPAQAKAPEKSAPLQEAAVAPAPKQTRPTTPVVEAPNPAPAVPDAKGTAVADEPELPADDPSDGEFPPHPSVEEGTAEALPEVAPEVVSKPAATTATFSVRGDVEVVYLRRGDEYRYPDDEVEPGTWQLWLQADLNSKNKQLADVELKAGENRVFHCSAASAGCK